MLAWLPGRAQKPASEQQTVKALMISSAVKVATENQVATEASKALVGAAEVAREAPSAAAERACSSALC